MKDLFLFDVDETLVRSSKKITDYHANLINRLKEKFDIGICGGGELKKILDQFDNKIYFNHYFTECGSVYHENENEENLKLNLVYAKDIRSHYLYGKINILIKESLKFLSNVDYLITGNFVDLRMGLVYISLIGMNANDEEREYFKNLDLKNNIRLKLIEILKEKLVEMNIENDICINIGGSVGIAIFPAENDKIQVIKILENKYNKIYYLGDKYEKNGNDYQIIEYLKDYGIKINNVEETFDFIKKFI